MFETSPSTDGSLWALNAGGNGSSGASAITPGVTETHTGIWTDEIGGYSGSGGVHGPTTFIPDIHGKRLPGMHVHSARRDALQAKTIATRDFFQRSFRPAIAQVTGTNFRPLCG